MRWPACASGYALWRGAHGPRRVTRRPLRCAALRRAGHVPSARKDAIRFWARLGPGGRSAWDPRDAQGSSARSRRRATTRRSSWRCVEARLVLRATRSATCAPRWLPCAPRRRRVTPPAVCVTTARSAGGSASQDLLLPNVRSRAVSPAARGRRSTSLRTCERTAVPARADPGQRDGAASAGGCSNEARQQAFGAARARARDAPEPGVFEAFGLGNRRRSEALSGRDPQRPLRLSARGRYRQARPDAIPR
jgi:hypothetical protein